MRLAPGVGVLRGYEGSWLRGDVVAGVTVTAYLVPQVMAYAGVAGLPAVTGLWAALATLLLYAVLGSSRQLSAGPESTTALLAASTVAPLAAGDPGRYAALAALLALVVGVLCLLGWVLRLGIIADLLGKPILVGYLAGVAVIMAVGQLDRVTGVPTDGSTLWDEIRTLLANLDQVQWPTVILATAVLVFLLAVQRFAPRWPGPLLAVVGSAALVSLLDLQAAGITVVGEIPPGVPIPSLPAVTLADIQALLLPALGVAVVAYSDNVLDARAFAARAGQRVDDNQELLALAATNAGAGLMHGFPVSSSASRTVIGVTSGSRTQLHSLVAAGCILLVLLFLGPALGAFPLAALGAIVVYAALRLVDVAELRRLWRFRRSEFVLAMTTTVGVLVLDILYGILLAVGLSVGLLLWRVARPNAAVLGEAPGIAGLHALDDYPDARTIPGLVVFRYDSPLFFANAADFRERALAAVDHERDTGTPPQWLLINAEANVNVDITAIDALTELHADLTRRGVRLTFARVKYQVMADLTGIGFVDLVGADSFFPTLPVAIQAYRDWAAGRP